ncbi:hypothetical protein TNCV_1599131 [Trichonephila clavipes]|nr:hypothetical protein TNCV_1599131 [Trichonephila clavipes]
MWDTTTRVTFLAQPLCGCSLKSPSPYTTSMPTSFSLEFEFILLPRERNPKGRPTSSRKEAHKTFRTGPSTKRLSGGIFHNIRFSMQHCCQTFQVTSVHPTTSRKESQRTTDFQQERSSQNLPYEATYHCCQTFQVTSVHPTTSRKESQRTTDFQQERSSQNFPYEATYHCCQTFQVTSVHPTTSRKESQRTTDFQQERSSQNLPYEATYQRIGDLFTLLPRGIPKGPDNGKVFRAVLLSDFPGDFCSSYYLEKGIPKDGRLPAGKKLTKPSVRGHLPKDCLEESSITLGIPCSIAVRLSRRLLVEILNTCCSKTA